MLVKATVEGPCTFRKTKGIKKWYGIYRTRTLVEYLDQNFKVEYRRLPHLFVFPLKTDLYQPKTPDFATIKNLEKILGNYCMSKGDFPHLNFYNYPH